MAASLLIRNHLCSDFNLKNLIGVTEDIEGHVLVTCKGVVKQYNVRDQKQLQSWTTKTWHPFTSAAICDPSSGNIVAVINHSSVSQWTHAEDDIDKVKRFNFETPIYQLIVSGGVVYVVFTSGHVEDLEGVMETRKVPKLGCVQEEETITYAAINKKENIAVLTVRDAENGLKLWKLQLNGGSPPVSCILNVKDSRLTGICLLSSRLFTLWSDGNMHSHSLCNDPIEKLPGRICSTVTSINTEKNTMILPISSSHLALVGADVKDEGGALVLWDIKFAVVTSNRRLKMYHNPPLSWILPDGIIILEGGALSCTPYVLTDSTLATVFGSRISKDAEYPPETCYGWDVMLDDKKGAMETIYTNKSEKLVEIIQNVNQLSLSESMLVGNVVEHLFENKSLILLHEVITVFEDIPESCLLKILQCYLKSKDSEFDGFMKYPVTLTEVKNKEDGEVVKCPFGPGKVFFINAVLKKPFTDFVLTKEISKLSFDDSLCLIQYLYFLILAGEALVCPGKDDTGLSLATVSEWLSLILDAKYHQLVMTSQVDIHRLLLSCFTKITEMCNLLQGLIHLEPLIRKMMAKDSTRQQENLSGRSYSIERLVITR